MASRDIKVALTYRTPRTVLLQTKRIITELSLSTRDLAHQGGISCWDPADLPFPHATCLLPLSPILTSPHLTSWEQGDLGSLWPSLIACARSFCTAFPISQVPLGQPGLCSTRLRRQTRHVPRDDTNKIYYVTKACNRW